MHGNRVLPILTLVLACSHVVCTDPKPMRLKYGIAPSYPAPAPEATAEEATKAAVRAPSSEPSAHEAPAVPSKQLAACVDQGEHCDVWASMGECAKNVEYMSSACPVACGKCTPSAADVQAAERRACVDKHSMCPTWASIGECDSNAPFMKAECRVSCAVCQSEACHDLAPDCAARAAHGGCYASPEMKDECRFTCLACNLKVEPKCARDRSIPPAAVKGSVDAMFRRITSTPRLGAFGNGTVRVASTDPWLITIDDFLSPVEADALLRAGGQGWGRSLAGEGVSSVRTSSTAWCSTATCLEDPTVMAVQDRVSKLTGIPTENGEFLQVLRYQEGQFYGTHSDQNAPRASAWGPRLYTVYFYLNDVAEGGGTRFPNVNVTVTPKKGRAAMWASVLNDDPFVKDTRTDHEAMPPRPGSVKYGANFWLHMYPFRAQSSRGCENALYADNWY